LILELVQDFLPGIILRMIRRSGKKNSDPPLQGVVIEKLSSSQVDGPFSSVIAYPTDALVLIRDGKIIEVFREGKFKTLDTSGSLRAVVRAGPDVIVLKVDLKPFTVGLNFGGDEESTSVERRFGKTPDSNGDLVSAAVTLGLSFNPDNARQALWFAGVDSFTSAQVLEWLAPRAREAVESVINAYEIKDLRTVEIRLRLQDEIRAKLEEGNKNYGLVIVDVSSHFGQTDTEQQSTMLKDAQAKLARDEVKAESRGLKTSGGAFTEIHGDQTISTVSGMSGITIVLLAAVILGGIAAVVFLIG
jgi:hypothetical protein